MHREKPRHAPAAADHEHVVELHVERPVRDAILRRQQHPDDQLVIARDTLRPHADIERANAEREIADADMRQASAQSPASSFSADGRYPSLDLGHSCVRRIRKQLADLIGRSSS
jgi:hypothetical protein